MAKLLQALTFLILALSVPMTQAQADQAGNVLFARGQVQAMSSEHGDRALKKSDLIYKRDRITTGAKGRIQMRFTDGGLISLMPDTIFSVDEYFYPDEVENASLVFGLLKGGLRTVTGAIGKVKHDQYELKTPVATLGIRGTEYTAVLKPANTLRVHVGRGKVVITNDQGTLEVPQGHNAVVVLGSEPVLSEQAPEYQATTNPTTLDTSSYAQFQDRYLLDPRDDQTFPGILSFEEVPPPDPDPMNDAMPEPGNNEIAGPGNDNMPGPGDDDYCPSCSTDYPPYGEGGYAP